MNKDAESWARVSADAVLDGSYAQTKTVLQMALDDIAELAREVQSWKGTQEQAIFDRDLAWRRARRAAEILKGNDDA